MPADPKSSKVFRAYLEANRRITAEVVGDDQYMTVAILNSFLGVTLWGGDDKEPVPLEEIAKQLHIAPTTFATHLAYLGERYRKGKPGMGLVALEPYLLNRRMKVARLTQKGRAVADSLAYILSGVQHNASEERPQ